MERCFIATKESELLKDYKKYESLLSEQRKLINDFFKEKGIESEEFLINGEGFYNVPFEEHRKSGISLHILPTQNDIENFGAMLKKTNGYNGLRSFKKNSKIAKEFAQKCVERKIVINLYKPNTGDHFDSIGLYGYRQEAFIFNDETYVKIESDFLKKDDTPKGFVEIKQSQYCLAKEELEKRQHKAG